MVIMKVSALLLHYLYTDPGAGYRRHIQSGAYQTNDTNINRGKEIQSVSRKNIVWLQSKIERLDLP